MRLKNRRKASGGLSTCRHSRSSALMYSQEKLGEIPGRISGPHGCRRPSPSPPSYRKRKDRSPRRGQTTCQPAALGKRAAIHPPHGHLHHLRVTVPGFPLGLPGPRPARARPRHGRNPPKGSHSGPGPAWSGEIVPDHNGPGGRRIPGEDIGVLGGDHQAFAGIKDPEIGAELRVLVKDRKTSRGRNGSSRSTHWMVA